MSDPRGSSFLRRLWAAGFYGHGWARRSRPVRRPWDRPSRARVWLSVGVEILVGLGWFALLVAGAGWSPRLAAALTLPVVAAWELFGWLQRPDGDPMKERRLYTDPFVRWLHGPDRPPPGFPSVGLREPWSVPDAELARTLTVEAQHEITSGHTLTGKALACLVACTGCDRVVFECHDGTWAIVDLAWEPWQKPPLPHTQHLAAFADHQQAMDDHRH